MTYKLYCDGGCRGNPGPCGIGGVIIDPEGTVIAEISEYVSDKQTNNYAEYSSLLKTLQKAIDLGINGSVIKIHMDSSLVVHQVKGLWKINNSNIIPLYNQVMEMLRLFTDYNIVHVFRDSNTHADSLANKAMNLKEINK